MPVFNNGALMVWEPLGHDQIILTSTPSALITLPNYPTGNAIRLFRAVIRNLGQPMEWLADGSGDWSKAFQNLPDEVLVLDSSFDRFLMRSATGADVRVAYMGG